MTAASRVERVAIALFDACNEWEPWATVRLYYEHKARAAIAAYETALAEDGLAIRPREPTSEMIENGCTEHSSHDSRFESREDSVSDIWRAMFDAAPQ